MCQSAIVPPLKYPGGKHYLASTIIDLMPKHLHYVEPYFGGGAVLLAKDRFDESKYWGDASHERGTSEVVNDIWSLLTNFWRVVQDPQAFSDFMFAIEATPFSQVEWQDAEARSIPAKPLDVPAAVAFFVRCRMSRAGEFRDFTPLSRNRTRRSQNEQVSSYWNCIEGLPAVHERLRRVVILHDDAVKVIQAQDGEKTLFYCDPPYLHETRTNSDRYAHELTEDGQRRLLDTIGQCKGAVMLSGYRNALYDDQLAAWNRHDFQIDNKTAGGTTKRKMTESIWTNV